MRLARRTALGGAVAAAIASAGLGPARAAILLRGAGSTFAAPLYARWIAAWRERAAAVSIDYDSVGSSEGISRFVTGSVDFAGTDALLSDAQIAQATTGVRMIPITSSGVVLAYNLPGVAELRLPREALAAVMAGEITRWDDPALAAANPGVALPSRDIALVARLDGSGTTYALTTHLSAIASSWRERFGIGTRIDWRGNAMLQRGNEGVSARIKQTENSIGYVEFGFAKRLGLPSALLQNAAGSFIAASADSVRNAVAEASRDMPADFRLAIPDPPGAGAYPMVTLSWVLLPATAPDPAKAQALQAFVRFGLTEGQALGAELGYVPLPEKVVTMATAALDTGL